MRVAGFRRSWAWAGVLGGALAAGTAAVAPVAAAGAAAPAAAHAASPVVVSGHVAAVPARGTPQLAPAGGTEQGRPPPEGGRPMYALRAVPRIRQGGKNYPRRHRGRLRPTPPH